MSHLLTPVAENSRVQRTKRWVSLWRIDRKDGVSLRFTNASRTIVFDTEGEETFGNSSMETFSPVAGFDSSATRQQLGLNPSDQEYRGILSSSAISDVDLQDGRYRDALITQWRVDAKLPMLGKIVKKVWWVQDVRLDGNMWVATVEGVQHMLRPRVGTVYTRTCPFEVFATGSVGAGSDLRNCKKDPTGYQAPDPVTGQGTPSAASIGPDIAQFDGPANRRDRVFGIPGGTNGLDPDPGIPGVPQRLGDFWTLGKIKWLTGPNVGLISEIKESEAFGNGGVVFLLRERLPNDITFGDQFSITAGCAKTKEVCDTKFNHLLGIDRFGNPISGGGFGGFSFLLDPQESVRGPFIDTV